MSFFAELRRRNVFKVGIAYAVVTWLVLQVSDVILNNIDAPGWVFGAIMLVLGIGFPIVLLFAWAFELTPEGLKREHEVERGQSITGETGKRLNTTILVLMSLAVAYLLVDKFFGGVPHSVTPPAGEAADAGPAVEPETAVDSPPAISRQSIAVLPFDNRSDQQSDEYFVEGVHDDLLTSLARIGSLKVISRTSVSKYKDTEKTIPEIAKELGVATVMEGAVQRSGDTVRINVQLIDAQTDEHLWAEIFDRELTAENLFAIQSEISQAIARALQATLSPEERQRISTMPTENLAAYDAYLRGRQLMATRNIAKLEQAIVEFTKATDLDPAFALAWVGLADSSMLLWNYGSRSGEETYRIMEEAVNRALAIDPGLGEAYATLGQIHEYYGRYEEMEAAYRKATELSPNYATAWHWYSIAVSQSNLRAQEAVDLARRAAELDPRAPIIGTNLASTYQAQGLLSLAERQFRSIIELNPDFAQAYGGLVIMKVFHMGQLDEALTLLAAGREIDPGNAVLPVLAAITLTELGDLEAAEQLQREFEATNPNDWRIGWVGQNINATRKNAAGMREAANWMLDRVSGVPFAINLTGLLELAYGDVQRAREIYLRGNPGWTDSSRWNQLIERDPTNACVMAWVLAHTGDERLGNDLLSKALDFHTQALPAAVEHPDASKPDICHLMAGDTESALASLETQLAHNHIFWLGHYGQLPMYEAIRHEPRYQAVMAEYDRRIAEQAERAAQMKLDIQS